MERDISDWISALEKLEAAYHNLDDFIDLKKKLEGKYDKFFESNKIVKDSYTKRAKDCSYSQFLTINAHLINH